MSQKGAASLPSRERGLKWFIKATAISGFFPVAPFAGAWIEIVWDEERRGQRRSRSLRGSVVEMLKKIVGVIQHFSRSLRGSVD